MVAVGGPGRAGPREAPGRGEGSAPKQAADRHDPLASRSEGFVFVNSAIPVCCARSCWAGAAGVAGQGPAVLFQIRLQQTAVLCAGVVPGEARQQLAAGVADHGDQVKFLAAPLQPVVLGVVPLDQLAAATPLRPPRVRACQLALAELPQTGRGHPAPRRFAAEVGAVALLQILRRQRRPKARVEGLEEDKGPEAPEK